MKIANRISEDLMGFKDDAIKSSFEGILKKFGFDLITVDGVSAEKGGDTVVTFGDPEGQLDVLFSYDEDDGGQATILDPDKDLLDDEEDELDIIELDPLDPKLMDFGDGVMGLDLLNLKWLTEAAMQAILTVGDLIDTQKDAGDGDEEGEIQERSVVVIRGGKKVRLPLVRKRRRRRLTAKQKAAIKRGARKRKAKSGAISRKRKRSLKLRKRNNLKGPGRNSRLKVAGTSTSKNFKGGA